MYFGGYLGASKTYLLDLGRRCFLIASLLHPAVQYCICIEATLPAFIPDWLLRNQKVLLLRRTQDATGVFPLSHGSDLHCSRPSSCLWLLSHSYCSSLDRCLPWQVPFLPYGFLCCQADKLCWGEEFTKPTKESKTMLVLHAWYPGLTSPRIPHNPNGAF